MKKRVFTSVLSFAILLSLGGCYRDDKGVIDAAEKYADAIVAMDADDIADLMEDDGGLEDAFAAYNSFVSKGEGAEDLLKAISDTMTYEIDSKSVESSTKDKKGSCDITFTLADYEDLYDEDYGIDEYIEAIENDDGDDAVEITVSVDFVYKKDKWLVSDAKCKTIGKVYGFIEDISEYNLFVSALDRDTFISILEDEFGMQDDVEYYVTEGDETWLVGCQVDIYGYDGSCFYEFLQFDEPSQAADYFENDYYYVNFKDTFDNNYMSGTYDIDFSDSDSSGYAVFDGTVSGANYLADGEFYGGIYCNDGVVVAAWTYCPVSGDKDKIDTFLNLAGYPTP